VDKRKDERFSTKLYVKLNSGSLTSWGVLSDISQNGLFIKSNRHFSIDALIDIEIFMPDKSISLLRGIVRRITEQPDSNRKFGIGIEIIEKDIIYKHFLKFFDGQAKTSVWSLSRTSDDHIFQK
jgi:Tfp pilus assembly protein PilZ